jgi:hypothetical protein
MSSIGSKTTTTMKLLLCALLSLLIFGTLGAAFPTSGSGDTVPFPINLSARDLHSDKTSLVMDAAAQRPHEHPYTMEEFITTLNASIPAPDLSSPATAASTIPTNVTSPDTRPANPLIPPAGTTSCIWLVGELSKPFVYISYSELWVGGRVVCALSWVPIRRTGTNGYTWMNCQNGNSAWIWDSLYGFAYGTNGGDYFVKLSAAENQDGITTFFSGRVQC